MPGTTAILTQRATILGDVFDYGTSVSADMTPRAPITLTAAKVGQLTTRGSNTAGTLTMAAGHGFTTAAKLDIYWAGGRRYNVTIGTVSVNSVPFTLGAGDNLPDNLTAVTAMIPHVETGLNVTAANIVGAVAKCVQAPATVAFLQSDDTLITALRPGDETNSDVWFPNLGVTPFGADVAKLTFSHSDSTAAREVLAYLMWN